MKILLLSDVEDDYLWEYYQPGRLKDYDLMLSAGDLKAEYLRFLVTMGRCPLLYVHGNHDTQYKGDAPEGCQCIEDKLITVNGLRILGLGGSPRYSAVEHQYTEEQMRRRIRRLTLALYRAGGVDIVLTHAPPRHLGDGEDMAHRGFEAFYTLLEKWQPQYLVHGHVHLNYNCGHGREQQWGQTKIVNAYRRWELDIEPSMRTRGEKTRSKENGNE